MFWTDDLAHSFVPPIVNFEETSHSKRRDVKRSIVGLRGQFDELLSISAAEISIDNRNKSFQTLVCARNVLVGADEVFFAANLRID